MKDYSELKRLAEACGDLNWRAIQENWTELAIRDDHGYIATMRTKSAKHVGPCPDRESKAKFLCAVTPNAVLELIAEVEALRKLPTAWSEVYEQSDELDALRDENLAWLNERDQLKADNDRQAKEIEALRKAVEFGADCFRKISSGDGSGHADLA